MRHERLGLFGTTRENVGVAATFCCCFWDDNLLHNSGCCRFMLKNFRHHPPSPFAEAKILHGVVDLNAFGTSHFIFREVIIGAIDDINDVFQHWSGMKLEHVQIF